MSTPAPQQHRILRQVIELQGCPRDEAAALQSAALRLFQRDWLPVIERLCSAMGDPQRVQRIDRLEIDLGPLPVQWLRDATAPPAPGRTDPTAPRVEAALAPRLAEALQTAPEVHTDQELLAWALDGGVLPWWADPADRQAVQRAAEALLQGPASAWRALLGTPRGDDAALRRLAAALDDATLARLLARLLADAPAADGAWPPAVDQAWRAALADAGAALRLPTQPLQALWWREALAAALAAPAAGRPGHAPAPAAWLPGVLGRMAAALGLPAEALPQALRRALDDPARTGDPAPLAALWPALALADGRPQPPGPATGRRDTATPPPAAPDAADAALAQALAAASAAALAASSQAAAALWARLQAVLDDLPAALRANLAAALLRSAGGADAARAAALDALLQRALQLGLLRPDAPAAAAGVPLPGAAAVLAQALRAAAAAAPSAAPPAAPVTSTAARPLPAVADTLVVGNAGLVLLWPFVTRFAERLGLLHDGRWRDAAAAWHAARLLQCVASGDPQPPEFQLPLNKLLCGLPLDAPMDRAEPLGDDEQAECEALLHAVIAQAPVLRAMSVAGFRGSFLLRTGQLGSRDGHWLLRVERQAWDLVLDRFPWSAGLVRLPWMPTLLQVQW